ncbi:MAG: hypothetical protein MH204_01305, partial [Fimbriimonadaceae bacterium]|nr:hypothetical protein [Fimbriimonadaceae bacterium]
VIGDRLTDLDRIEGEFDLLIDTCAYIPRHVQTSHDALKGRVGKVCFISTISVYDHEPTEPLDEESPVLAPRRDTEEVTAETYGPLKSACEQDLAGWGCPVQVVRPGFIVGPFDPTDRWTWWVDALSLGGRAPLPRPGQPIQWIDVRDLAAFCLTLAREQGPGIWNACGPVDPSDLRSMVLRMALAVNPETALVDADLTEESGIPMVMEGSEAHRLMRASNLKALEAGLRLRPVEETARDTLAWWRGQDRAPKVGPKAEEVLALLDGAGRP